MQEMKKLSAWNPQELLHSLIFEPLWPMLGHFPSGDFPSLDELNGVLGKFAPQIIVKNGRNLRFVPQSAGKQSFEAQYEPRCYLNGEVQTREQNWHDLFNALVWMTFPMAKATINARHYQLLAVDGREAVSRSSGRDMLTLLDESGLVIACANECMGKLLREFHWRELFWQQREEFPGSMGCYLFGHGLYEKALHPYVGMTGHALILEVEHEFFAWPLQRRLDHLDELLSAYLAGSNHCQTTRELSPVPVLGIPGWSADNGVESYYDDTSYFRAGRLSLKTGR